MRRLLPILLAACQAPTLVPPTVDEDPELPAFEAGVDGTTRRLHLRTLGDPADPVLFVMHGSASDHRAWLPLAEALSDRWFVVLWDQAGSGLSTRLDPGDVYLDGMAQEVEAVKGAFSPDTPVAVVAHSWGGMNLGHVLRRDPDLADRVVLIEPGPLTGEVMEATFRDFFRLDLADPDLNAQQWSWETLSRGDHESLDLKYLATLQGTLLQYHCDPEAPPPWPVWRVGAVLERERQRDLRAGGTFDYDFAAPYRAIDEVTLVASRCSAIGADMQRLHHLPLIPEAELVELADVGHRMIVEDEEAVIAAVRDALR